MTRVFSLVPLFRQGRALSPDEEKLFRFEEQHFDAIILGDLYRSSRLSGGNIDVS